MPTTRGSMEQSTSRTWQILLEQPTAGERILFKCPWHEAKMGHFLGHITNLKRFFTTEVTPSVSHL